MTFLALHGFTQRGSMWGEVAALVGGEWIAPDLPGHGATPPCPWDEAVSSVASLLSGAAAPRCLVGYSMGGRLSLAVAVEHPEALERLVLISGSPGISDLAERSRRGEEDGALAARIEEVGVGAFLEEWLAQPWFAGPSLPSPEWQAAERAIRLGSSARGLAGALRLLGQGAQPYLGDRLADLSLPVLLVAGSDDRRYADLAVQMGREIRRATVHLIDGAAHAVVGERPEAVATAMGDWLASG
jgi:2-succinyl-6-hydroxy-2,4-cyclohexadiene-1-carboxylate synthase